MRIRTETRLTDGDEPVGTLSIMVFSMTAARLARDLIRARGYDAEVHAEGIGQNWVAITVVGKAGEQANMFHASLQTLATELKPVVEEANAIAAWHAWAHEWEGAS